MSGCIWQQPLLQLCIYHWKHCQWNIMEFAHPAVIEEERTAVNSFLKIDLGLMVTCRTSTKILRFQFSFLLSFFLLYLPHNQCPLYFFLTIHYYFTCVQCRFWRLFLGFSKVIAALLNQLFWNHKFCLWLRDIQHLPAIADFELCSSLINIRGKCLCIESFVMYTHVYAIFRLPS